MFKGTGSVGKQAKKMGFKDYTLTGDKILQSRYLSRATRIKGEWKNNKYSPNMLSIHLLWL